MSTGSVPNSSWHPSDLAVVTRLGLLSLSGYLCGVQGQRVTIAPSAV